MSKQFELRMEAERFIHNDLAQCAHQMRETAERKHSSDQLKGVYYEELACMIFCAFAIEAKVNFVGWKVLGEGWPDSARLYEKIDLLREVIPLQLDWGQRPLQSIQQLTKFRNIVAHGKPERFTDVQIVEDDDPDIWGLLDGSWQKNVSRQNMNRYYDDMEEFWQLMLAQANIRHYDTVNHGSHSLTTLKSTPV